MLDDRRVKLNAEIEDLKQRQHDDMNFYGCGGMYQRKENAIKRRREQLEELEAFARGRTKSRRIFQKTGIQSQCGTYSGRCHKRMGFRTIMESVNRAGNTNAGHFKTVIEELTFRQWWHEHSKDFN